MNSTPGNYPILRRELFTVVAYILLAVVYTYPLILHFNTHVIGPYYGDNFEYVWKTWWVAEAIFERGESPFFHPEVYYPNGYELAYGEITPIHTILPVFLTWQFGEIFVYNFNILLSFVLSGWFMTWLARRWLAGLTDSPTLLTWTAFFCGVAFTFCSYRITRAVGHLPLIDTHWLILAFLGLDRWIEKRRMWDAALIGLSISLAALSSWYYPFMLMFLMPVYLLARLKNWQETLSSRQTWLGTALAIGIIFILCLPFLIPYLQLSSEGQTRVPLKDASFWAASPLDYLMPNALHPLWGNPVQFAMWPSTKIDMPLEFIVAPDWVVLFLGFWAWRKLKGEHWTALKWVIGVAFVLSLGTHLHISRIPTPLPLPALLLREIVPTAESVRSWGRFSIFVVMGLDLIAGAGLILLIQHQPEIQRAKATLRILAMALVLLVFFSWTGPAELVKIEPRPVDEWLAAQPDDTPLMQFPVEEALSGPAMLYTKYHQKPVVFGYGTYFPFIFKEKYPELWDFPDDASLDRLEAWQVGYILVQTDSDEIDMESVEAQPRLKHVITLDNQAVFELID